MANRCAASYREPVFRSTPGIYLPEFGVRGEVDVMVDKHEQVHVTGGTPQDHVLAILKEC
jgi:hypothetical protein